MHPLLLAVLNVVGGAAGLALVWYALYRAVLSAKKSGRAGVGGQIMATALTLFSSGSALDPAREVATESQKLKRNQDGNGDPENEENRAVDRESRRDHGRRPAPVAIRSTDGGVE